MKLTRAIPAGIIDAGLTSVATFILGLYAIAAWEDADLDTLGIYFLYMTASVMASTVPHQLLFVPAEKVSLEVPRPARIAIFGRIVRLGLPVAVAAASLVAFATVVGSSSSSQPGLRPSSFRSKTTPGAYCISPGAAGRPQPSLSCRFSLRERHWPS
jgi:hypothetical protein